MRRSVVHAASSRSDPRAMDCRPLTRLRGFVGQIMQAVSLTKCCFLHECWGGNFIEWRIGKDRWNIPECRGCSVMSLKACDRCAHGLIICTACVRLDKPDAVYGCAQTPPETYIKRVFVLNSVFWARPHHDSLSWDFLAWKTPDVRGTSVDSQI